jgi:hypothetical protein
MNIEVEIAALQLAFAYLYRGIERSASVDQEVADIMTDAAEHGSTAGCGDSFADDVRAALTRLLRDCKYVGVTRPAAGEIADARRIRARGGNQL